VHDEQEEITVVVLLTDEQWLQCLHYPSGLQNSNASFKAFTAVMFQVKVFWVVTPYSIVVGYQHFRGPCCLHLQGEVIGGGSVEL